MLVLFALYKLCMQTGRKAKGKGQRGGAAKTARRGNMYAAFADEAGGSDSDDHDDGDDVDVKARQEEEADSRRVTDVHHDSDVIVAAGTVDSVDSGVVLTRGEADDADKMSDSGAIGFHVEIACPACTFVNVAFVTVNAPDIASTCEVCSARL